MDIFISWSGPRSGAVAEALKKWLPMIVNAFKPWLSSADIDKGARWSTDVAAKLQAAKAGIICLTPGNLSAPWILFEAGALSKTLENTFVCPLLVDLEPSDVTGPMAQFQATRATKDEMLKLLRTLNGGLKEAALPAAQIEEAFDVWWPKLEAELRKLPAEGHAQRPQRTDRELLEELVDTVRGKGTTESMLMSQVVDLSARLQNTETALRLERTRVREMQRQAASLDAEKEMWVLLGRAFANSDPAIRAATEAPSDPTAEQVTSIVEAARKAKAKNFMKRAQKENPEPK